MMTEDASANDNTVFPFEESPRLGVYTTAAVASGARPVLLVWHEDDGDWQFLPGNQVDLDEAIALHLLHMLERHPELVEVADLPRGWAAERETTTDPWRRYRLTA